MNLWKEASGGWNIFLNGIRRLNLRPFPYHQTISVPPKTISIPPKTSTSWCHLERWWKFWYFNLLMPHHMNTLINFFQTICLLMAILGNDFVRGEGQGICQRTHSSRQNWPLGSFSNYSSKLCKKKSQNFHFGPYKWQVHYIILQLLKGFDLYNGSFVLIIGQPQS